MTRTEFDPKKETQGFSSRRTFANELVRLLDGCESVLDVGCGGLSPARFLPCARLTGVDITPSNLEQAKAFGTHDAFFLCDARELASRFKPGEFEACAALDVVEHLTKGEGPAFLGELERLARKRVVVFTPNGFRPQSSKVEGDNQEHLSGWTPDEMRELGYSVIGMGGLKKLRAESHQLRWEPKFFWAVVSWCSQHLWCRAHPDSAAAILCWKDK